MVADQGGVMLYFLTSESSGFCLQDGCEYTEDERLKISRGPMMITVRIIINVLPEKQKEVLLTLLSLMRLPEKERGCLSYGIYADIEDENVFNLLSEWQTRQHLNHHIRSDRFSVLLGIKSLLSDSMNIQIVTVSNSEGIEAVNSVRKKGADLQS